MRQNSPMFLLVTGSKLWKSKLKVNLLVLLYLYKTLSWICTVLDGECFSSVENCLLWSSKILFLSECLSLFSFYILSIQILIVCIFLECWDQELDISILLKERMLQQGICVAAKIFLHHLFYFAWKEVFSSHYERTYACQPILGVYLSS